MLQSVRHLGIKTKTVYYVEYYSSYNDMKFNLSGLETMRNLVCYSKNLTMKRELEKHLIERADNQGLSSEEIFDVVQEQGVQ